MEIRSSAHKSVNNNCALSVCGSTRVLISVPCPLIITKLLPISAITTSDTFGRVAHIRRCDVANAALMICVTHNNKIIRALTHTHGLGLVTPAVRPAAAAGVTGSQACPLIRVA